MCSNTVRRLEHFLLGYATVKNMLDELLLLPTNPEHIR